jgi:hypothetical protein
MKQEKSLQRLSDAELLILVCGELKQQPKQDIVLERTWRWHQKNWRTLAKSTSKMQHQNLQGCLRPTPGSTRRPRPRTILCIVSQLLQSNH